MPTIVSPDSYSGLFRAFAVIHADNNPLSSVTLSEVAVPDRWSQHDLDAADIALRKLRVEHPKKFEMFCYGDHDVQVRLMNSSHELTRAHEILEDYFGGFQP